MLKPDYLIRKMTEQDLDCIMRIEKESFTLPWSRESFAGELKNQFSNYLVCDCEGEVAAYVGIWVVYEEAHITNVAVGVKYRRMGIGRALMLEAEKLARQKKAHCILLEVRPSNQAALNMYRELGYVPTGLRKAYYSDNQEDAIVMTKYFYDVTLD
jgi:ribosomal-protein-alanine N-acetyltransferase